MENMENMEKIEKENSNFKETSETLEILNKEHEEKFSVSFWFTHAIGSPASVVLHTIIFLGTLSLYWSNYNFNTVLLILTTAVSLEAIYLAIFIQMTVNREAHHLSKVSKDIDEIQEDVEEIAEDVEDITEEMEREEREEGGENPQEKMQNLERLKKIEATLHHLLGEIGEMKK